MIKVLSIVGTRPEALKLAPVLLALEQDRKMQSIVCITGQHRTLAPRALEWFGLKADLDLAARTARQPPSRVVAEVLRRLGPVVERVQPNWIMAVGDTSSVVAASLAALYHHVPFAHVEAGLRSEDKWAPFPEEGNRRIVGATADLHLAPTEGARRNLLRESIPDTQIEVTGNPGIDALRLCGRAAVELESLAWWRRWWASPPSDKPMRLIVTTFHRRENFGQPAESICAALREVVRHYDGAVRVLCLVHPNAAMKQTVRRLLDHVPGVCLRGPLDYPTMVATLKRAHVLLTDSGGLQEEAPCLKVPVLVLRDRTERPEGVAAGVARIVGTTQHGIVKAVKEVIDDEAVHRAMSKGCFAYGDGHAAKRIVAALKRHLGRIGKR